MHFHQQTAQIEPDVLTHQRNLREKPAEIYLAGVNKCQKYVMLEVKIETYQGTNHTQRLHHCLFTMVIYVPSGRSLARWAFKYYVSVQGKSSLHYS